MSPQGSREKTSEPILDKFSFAANAAICNLFLYTIFYRETMTRIDEADLLKTHLFTFKLNSKRVRFIILGCRHWQANHYVGAMVKISGGEH